MSDPNVPTTPDLRQGPSPAHLQAGLVADRPGPPVLGVVALVLAILLAPVGLVVGIVAAVRSKRQRGNAGVLPVIAIVVGATLTAIAGALFLGLKGTAEDNPLDDGQGQEQEYLPEEEGLSSGYEIEQEIEAQKNYNEFIESFNIERDSNATFDQVVSTYVENYEKWMNAGLTLQYDMTLMTGEQKMIDDVQNKFDTQIIERMFTDSGTARSLANDYEKSLRLAILQSFWISTGDPESTPYKWSAELLNVQIIESDSENAQEATTFVARVDMHFTDNGNENLAALRRDHGQPEQIDVTRHEDITFVLNPSTNTWEIDNVQAYVESESNTE